MLLREAHKIHDYHSTNQPYSPNTFLTLFRPKRSPFIPAIPVYLSQPGKLSSVGKPTRSITFMSWSSSDVPMRIGLRRNWRNVGNGSMVMLDDCSSPSLTDHLGEDTADTPDIRLCRIVAGAHTDFWRPVPTRDDIRCVAPLTVRIALTVCQIVTRSHLRSNPLHSTNVAIRGLAKPKSVMHNTPSLPMRRFAAVHHDVNNEKMRVS